MRKLCDYLTVGQAATLLGVSEWTLRYWDRTGKLKPQRHPLSGYRLYLREQLQELLRLTASGSAEPRKRHRPTRKTTTPEAR
jgi:hypothetical protein